MKLIFKNAFWYCLLFGVITMGVQTVQANTIPTKDLQEFKQTVKKNFEMKADGQVTLINKYGNINLKTWNKNNVDIEITITVKARNESTADRVFERLNFNFANNPDAVKAETLIESSKSSWWNESNGNNKADFRIDYEVSIPKAASLSLNNKYGDSKIAAVGGSAKLVVKYGDFDIAAVGDNAEISLGYGNGTIGRLQNVGIDMKYSKIKLAEASRVNIQSKYSKIYIDKANTIKSESKYDTYGLGELKELINEGKYDHFEVEKVEEIRAYAKYSDFEIEKLYDRGDFELKYGGVKIKSLQDGFDMVALNCEHSDCKIYTDGTVNFEIDAVATHGAIRYPEGMNVSYEKDGNSTHEVKGHQGRKGGGKIKARLRYGALKIK